MFSIVLLLLFGQAIAENCVTPNNEPAQCVSLFDCPIFLRAIQTQDKDVLEFYGNSTCGGTVSNPKVCCGTSTTFTKQDNRVTLGTSKFLQYENECGLQPSVTEYPWFAKLKYPNPLRPFYICTGSLITENYVVTAAFCIVTIMPEAVRLGKYNHLNKPSCTEDSTLLECNGEVQEFGIQKLIHHPNYGEQIVYVARETLLSKRRTINDIGLIQLNGRVRMTDYVRPICLPFADTPRIADGDEVIVLKNDQWDFNMKSKFVRKVLGRKECELKVGTVHAGHMCTTPTVESCQVHNLGGPVVSSRSYKGSMKWFLVGVEPSQFITCYKNETRVYMDINYYRGWIENNIKP